MGLDALIDWVVKFFLLMTRIVLFVAVFAAAAFMAAMGVELWTNSVAKLSVPGMGAGSLTSEWVGRVWLFGQLNGALHASALAAIAGASLTVIGATIVLRLYARLVKD